MCNGHAESCLRVAMPGSAKQKLSDHLHNALCNHCKLIAAHVKSCPKNKGWQWVGNATATVLHSAVSGPRAARYTSLLLQFWAACMQLNLHHTYPSSAFKVAVSRAHTWHSRTYAFSLAAQHCAQLVQGWVATRQLIAVGMYLSWKLTLTSVCTDWSHDA